jgi:DNA polymerase alpha subunit A
MDEMKANPALKVDIDYYLAQQVHPVVTRLIECLEGTDAVRVAECLGTFLRYIILLRFSHPFKLS